MPADTHTPIAPRSVANNQTMPQNREAEEAILAAMLMSTDALEECLTDLKEEDFFHIPHRTVFSALHAMFDRSMPIDTISLADYLKSQDQLDSVGGRLFLLNLSSNSLALVGWRHHMEILHRDRILREMIYASSKIIDIAHNAPEDTKEVVDQAERLLLDVTNQDIRRNEESIDTILADVYEELQKGAAEGDGIQGVRTGFPTIDQCLLGLRAGQMVVIGARPGVGKTSFALNLATNAAYHGASVAFFSLEMSRVEIAQRLLAAYSRVGLREIRSSRIAREQWPALVQAVSDISELDIVIDDTPGTTVTEIRAKARRILHGKENGLVIVDYLQLISPPSGRFRADSRATEVSEMSRGIKILAKDLGVPVVALSQLNRTVENRQGKRPQLSDLRESGSIEQDADIVALLDRSMTEEEANREDRPGLNETTFIIAKNRSGALADVPLTFLGGSTKFVEIDRNHNN